MGHPGATWGQYREPQGKRRDVIGATHECHGGNTGTRQESIRGQCRSHADGTGNDAGCLVLHFLVSPPMPSSYRLL